jgi:hypothetical protein
MTKQGVGLNERTATDDNFGAAPRDEVEGCKLLKNANGVVRQRLTTGRTRLRLRARKKITLLTKGAASNR